jgi:hypothetical protein
MKVVIGTLEAVLWIRDPNFSILDPGSRVDKIPDPDLHGLGFFPRPGVKKSPAPFFPDPDP